MKSAGCQYSLPASSEEESELSIVGGPKSLRSLNFKENATRAESSRIGSNISKDSPPDATVDKGRDQSETICENRSEKADPSKTRTIVKGNRISETFTVATESKNTRKVLKEINQEIENVRKKDKVRKKISKKSEEKALETPAKVRNFTVSCTPDPNHARLVKKSKKAKVKESAKEAGKSKKLAKPEKSEIPAKPEKSKKAKRKKKEKRKGLLRESLEFEFEDENAPDPVEEAIIKMKFEIERRTRETNELNNLLLEKINFGNSENPKKVKTNPTTRKRVKVIISLFIHSV